MAIEVVRTAYIDPFFVRAAFDILDTGLKTAALPSKSGQFLRQKGPSGPHRLHQWADAHYLYHALQVIREHMQTHLGRNLL